MGEQTLCGTPAFLAPEVIRRSKHTTSSDIWSLGVVVYDMAFGKIPWPIEKKMELLFKIGSGSFTVDTDGCPPSVASFINACLQFVPTDRLSGKELLVHPMLTDVSSAEDTITVASKSSGKHASSSTSVSTLSLVTANNISLKTLSILSSDKPSSDKPSSDNQLVPIVPPDIPQAERISFHETGGSSWTEWTNTPTL